MGAAGRAPSNVLIVTPERVPAVRGNAITVDRIAESLRQQGLTISVTTPAELAAARSLSYGLGASTRPDLIHAFHALTAGSPARVLAEQLGVPLVITATGTDANVDLLIPDRRDEVL